MKKTTPTNTHTIQGEMVSQVNVQSKNSKRHSIVIGVAVVFILVALFFTKGFFVAATVNGRLISRLSVIRELEKQGGKQVLKSIINNKIIETELSKQNIRVTSEEIDEEIKKIEAQVTSQGGTLEAALSQQNLTKEKLREQITIQKKLQKLLADKIAVTDADIDTHIKDSKATPPKDIKEEDYRMQIREQLNQQKFQQEAQKWVSDLTSRAKVNYYVTY